MSAKPARQPFDQRQLRLRVIYNGHDTGRDLVCRYPPASGVYGARWFVDGDPEAVGSWQIEHAAMRALELGKVR